MMCRNIVKKNTYCGGGLYIYDSRAGKKASQLQYTKRRYVCPECGARFLGLEVLNPIPYAIKPLTKAFREKSARQVITEK